MKEFMQKKNYNLPPDTGMLFFWREGVFKLNTIHYFSVFFVCFCFVKLIWGLLGTQINFCGKPTRNNWLFLGKIKS